MFVTSFGKGFLLISLFFIEIHGLIFNECELVKELRKQQFQDSLIPIWVCIALEIAKLNEYKELYTGRIINHQNKKYHGIFGLLENNDCLPNAKGGKCNMKCDEFRTNDITAAATCTKEKFAKTGFNSWRHSNMYDKCVKAVSGSRFWLCCD